MSGRRWFMEGADFSVSYAYDSRGNITDIMRNGVIDRTENVETFGELEYLTYTYDGGNRFSSIDPLCEKHPDQSHYLFCGANPVRYTDPTGMAFTDNAINYASELVTEAFSKMQEKGISKEEKDQYAKFVQEIGTMLISDQLFDVEVFEGEKPGMEEEPHTYYNLDNNAVTFAFPSFMFVENESNAVKNLRLGEFAHEFKHGYQFLTGKIDLKYGTKKEIPKGLVYLYDVFDEFEAYDREALFSTDIPTKDEILTMKQYKLIGRAEIHLEPLINSRIRDYYQGKSNKFHTISRTNPWPGATIFRPQQ